MNRAERRRLRSTPHRDAGQVTASFGALGAPEQDMVSNIVLAVGSMEHRCDGCLTSLDGHALILTCVELSETHTSIRGRWLCVGCGEDEGGPGPARLN